MIKLNRAFCVLHLEMAKKSSPTDIREQNPPDTRHMP